MMLTPEMMLSQLGLNHGFPKRLPTMHTYILSLIWLIRSVRLITKDLEQKSNTRYYKYSTFMSRHLYIKGPCTCLNTMLKYTYCASIVEIRVGKLTPHLTPCGWPLSISRLCKKTHTNLFSIYSKSKINNDTNHTNNVMKLVANSALRSFLCSGSNETLTRHL